MRLPRGLSGEEFVRLLGRRYDYRPRRSRGSHVTVTLTTTTGEHSVTVPRHREVRIGTLNRVVSDVAAFLGVPKGEVREKLFGR